MFESIFAAEGITGTLKNLRQIVSSFPKNAGSVTVVSISRVNTQLNQWKTLLPSVTPFYAVKCNPEPRLLTTLLDQGVQFDCASLREVSDIKKATKQKTPSILYAHPMKSDRDIRMIEQMGITTTVVDSIEECKKLEECGWKGDAYLRVAVGDKGSKMPFSAKFGARFDEIDRIAKGSKIHLSGVSFHVGSGCITTDQYTKAIEYSFKKIFKILNKNGHYPNLIDIGGGFSANPSEFNHSAKSIRKGLQLLPESLWVIAEPGRYFAQPSQDLFVKVIAKKRGLDGISWRYVIDESLYGHFSCIPFDHQTPAWFRVSESDTESKRQSSEAILFGRTCDSLDVIAKGCMENLEVGDWLYFPLMGAYTSATASEFNGFPKPHIVTDNGLLPEAPWKMVDAFHKNNPLVYSNALKPIL
jgi:ornithine decarboxylase